MAIKQALSLFSTCQGNYSSSLEAIHMPYPLVDAQASVAEL